MTIGKALRDLGGVVDELEAGDAEVVTVGIEDELDDGTDAVSATVGVAVRLYDDGPDDGVEIAPGDVRLDDEGRLRLDLTITAHGDVEGASGTGPPEDGVDDASPDSVAAGDGEPVDAADADGDDGGTVPPHRDPDRLREVYDEDRTFQEMTEALDADVTAQTVRRNMIEHGIHDPTPASAADPAESTPDGGDEAEDGGDAGSSAADDGAGAPPDDEEPADADEEDVKTALADGIDLPAGTSLDDIKDAVRSGRTLYEVQTRLGVDRARARRILRELGLIDLVGGRIRTGEREVTDAEIEERIQGAAPSGT